MNYELKSIIDLEKLQSIASRESANYSNADPFPHIVIDNLFSEKVLTQILGEFPSSDQTNWIHYDKEREKGKSESKDETELGYVTRQTIHELNASGFLTLLEQLTGIKGLLPDPHLFGGGLHQIQKGGYLNIHADFNWYAKVKLYRRLNLLLYLNKNWLEEYGGHLELWDKKMSACQKKILPVFNRCVIFSTNHDSFHGHPEPLTCPEGWTRKSLALYYYTAEKAPMDIAEPHNTLWKSRPGDIRSSEKKYDLKRIAKKFVPPILIDIKNKFF
jgi:Rps23 Pro-64 3,4-dihydroxylase Tpa1-like proline 4-hydroxylase